MMMFAILFGLSMDYEVFLLSRVREEYVRSGDNADAVAEGLAQTAGALADAMRLAPSAITHHVSTLELCGLVERERHGRHVLIRLTERGSALLDVYDAGQLTAV
jgi:DNA-binding transcriptional ArsR family regulator